jgi:hypothetical protein
VVKPAENGWALHRARRDDELLSEHRVFDHQLFTRAEEVASEASD